MRESLARLTPQYSANRTVREYTETRYHPAAEAYCRRAAEGGKGAAAIRQWQRELSLHWNTIRFGEVHVETRGPQHLFHVPVYLDELAPDAVSVELYADPAPKGGRPFRTAMARVQPLAGSVGGYLYSAEAPAHRPAGAYTPRIVPSCNGVSVPLEAGQILWQR
jgi:starch phosphorylase